MLIWNLENLEKNFIQKYCSVKSEEADCGSGVYLNIFKVMRVTGLFL